MPSLTPAATLAVLSGNEIGEGPVWDATLQRLLWVDHVTGAIGQMRYVPAEAGEPLAQETLPARHQDAASRRAHLVPPLDPGEGLPPLCPPQPPLAAVVLRERGGLALVKHTEGVLLEADGTLTPFTGMDAAMAARIRWCDAKCDVQGRIWASGFAQDLAPCEGLYRIDPDGEIRPFALGTRLANGLAFSPDSATLYVADSLGPSILAMDFDAAAGTVGLPRTLVTFPPGSGGPNGIAVDRHGTLWVAMTGGGVVQACSPAGELLAAIPTPLLPTSCAFGGLQGAQLFITTRRGTLPPFAVSAGLVSLDRQTDESPEAGAVFVATPGVTGAPPHRFAR